MAQRRDCASTDHPRFADYLGPVGWNIGGGPLGPEAASDHECWAMGLSAKACANKYLLEIDKMKKGIVLFHDVDERTADMFIKYIYPRLKEKGYKIIPLDEVPYYKKQMTNNTRPIETPSLPDDGCYEPSGIDFDSSSFTVLHGENGTDYDAQMTNVKKPAGAIDGFQHYFDLKHSDGDSSTVGLIAQQIMKTLLGKDLLSPWNQSMVIPFALQWSCDKWVGQFQHSDGYKETLSISLNK